MPTQDDEAEVGVAVMRMKFAWSNVEPLTVQQLLRIAYESNPEELAELPKADLDRTLALASAIYGSQPAAAQLDRYPESWRVLQEWAARYAPAEQLTELAKYVARGQRLNTADVEVLAASTARMRKFVADRERMTDNFKANLLKAFLRANKSPQPSTRRPSDGSTSPAAHPIAARGAGEQPTVDVYPHHLEARAALDRMARDTNPDGRRGLIVLPTGAGKTTAVSGWVVPYMAEHPDVRVLWLAHQHELLAQAARSIERAARYQPTTFQRQLRIISSQGSAVTTLVDTNNDVALVTWQSLSRNWATKQALLAKFTANRPTIVIVDEAHRAAAPGYQQLLDFIRSIPGVMLIGLTATPWPAGYGAVARLQETFPTEVIRRSTEELHASGILAIPVLHTVDTGTVIELSSDEQALATKFDLPPSILARLSTAARDGQLAQTWSARRSEWGKSLVFASTIAHADKLGKALAAFGADVRVLHSGSPDRRAALDWFRASESDPVLVSVGMLTEGVDIPDARTAFLARPTTSRILLRQMIGRVLRGPKAGGDEFANIVYLRDQWANFDGVLSPAELPGLGAVETTGEPTETGRRLPPVLDEASGNVIAQDVVAELVRMYNLRTNAIALDAFTSSAALVGYYKLDDINIPVLAHQQDAYDAVLRRVLAADEPRRRPGALFEDIHPPYPTRSQLRAFTDYVGVMEQAPPFVAIRASVDPLAVARRLRSAGAMTEQDRTTWLNDEFEKGLGRVRFPSFDHFAEAVQHELDDLRRADGAGSARLDAERMPAPGPHLPHLEVVERALPTAANIVKSIRTNLAGEPVIDDLRDDGVPAIAWTGKPSRSTFAHWSYKTSGKGAGKRSIKVNLALSISDEHLADETLEYLVYHEMLHDLLPGQGHDAEFRRLEALWPDSAEHDCRLDTLHEKFVLPGQSTATGQLR